MSYRDDLVVELTTLEAKQEANPSEYKAERIDRLKQRLTGLPPVSETPVSVAVGSVVPDEICGVRPGVQDRLHPMLDGACAFTPHETGLHSWQ